MIHLAFATALFLLCTIFCNANDNHNNTFDEQIHTIQHFLIDKDTIKESFHLNNNSTFHSHQSTTARQLKPSSSKSKLSSRSQSWLNSHNTHRKYYHTKYKTTYIPLTWSDTLAREAEKYAQKLLSKCGFSLNHDTSTSYGENLATGYGKIPVDTENVLTRWVEMEEKDNYPQNGHYTQVLWRATEYVGCGEAETLVVRGNRELRRKRPNNKRPGKNAKGGKRGKNDKPGKGNGGKGNGGKGNGGKGNGGKGQGSKADKEETGSFKCQIQVCRYARYVINVQNTII